MIKEIVKLIEEIAKGLDDGSGDIVRDMYSVKRQLDLAIGSRINKILEERRNCADKT